MYLKSNIRLDFRLNKDHFFYFRKTISHFSPLNYSILALLLVIITKPGPT